jgi:DNA-binding GntR family transcriptional regulator
MAFHDLIAANAANSLLVEALVRLHSHIHLFRVPDPRREMRRATSEHGELIAAIADKAPELAAAAMARHIAHSRDRYIGS